jgi:hypothetical protein
MVRATNSKGKVGSDEITITIGEGGSSTTTTSATAPSTATIGQSGGTIAVGKARLEIPPGALDKDTQVSISEVTGVENLVGPAYDLQPTGLQFSKLATLIIDYSTTDLPEGSQPDEVAIVSLDEHYEPAQDDTAAPLLSSLPYFIETTVDESKTTASAQITHFSRYGFGPTPTLTASPQETKWIIHPTEETPYDYFDYGKEQSFNALGGDATGVVNVNHSLLLRYIWLHVETFCESNLCGGDVAATCYIAKVFRVKAGQKTQTISGAVGCNVLDIGGDSTGNCNVGERRVRVFDLGTGEKKATDVPLQIGSESDEWSDMPQAATGTPPTPHIKTSPDGKDYILSVTFTVDHYYAVVVDLMAVSAVNNCSAPWACCPSSQDWGPDEFVVTSLILTTGS